MWVGCDSTILLGESKTASWKDRNHTPRVTIRWLVEAWLDGRMFLDQSKMAQPYDTDGEFGEGHPTPFKTKAFGFQLGTSLIRKEFLDSWIVFFQQPDRVFQNGSDRPKIARPTERFWMWSEDREKHGDK